ncbi:MAG TPA: VWA domain-containing protein [Candidatus Polarisedimenticolaceae bacterium]|nr:VWA domain-containing protein [Candidatus Polarisedimenticolaceae bacterium]
MSKRISLALVASASFSGALAAGTLEFETPRHLSTVLGPTEIRLRLSDVDASTAEQMVIRVDGQLVASLTRPPWTAAFDAGDGTRGHRIEAILSLTDGSVLRAAVRTSPLRIDETLDVDLVSLYPLVLDPAGGYVRGLSAEDFAVLEDGQPQRIQRFTTEQRPIRLAFVIDTSLSMSKGGRLASAKSAALGFLEVLSDRDDALVVAFADRVELLQDVTQDRVQLGAAIESTTANGGTALYDAIWRTCRRLEDFDGRRVMVLLSDGRDEAANGFEPGSLHTLEEARLQAVKSEVMIFAIGLGRDLDSEFAREWTRSGVLDTSGSRVSLKRILETLAVHSGGRLLLTQSASKLRRAFAAVADDLRNQYSLAYTPSNDRDDGSYRKIEVTVPGRQVEVVVRKGYFARDEEAGDDSSR